MLSAPIGSIYIWHNSDFRYAVDLAKHLRREDLQIVSPSWLERSWYGLELSGIVVDHYTELTVKQWEQLDYARQRITQPNPGKNRGAASTLKTGIVSPCDNEDMPPLCFTNEPSDSGSW